MHTTRAYMEGRHKKESQLILFAEAHIVFLAGLLRGQPHRVSGRKDVAKYVSVFTDVPGATRLVGRGGGGRRVDLKRVCVWDARFHLGGEAPGLEEVVFLHHL